MAEDLSRDGVARRKAAEEAATTAQVFRAAAERPEQVIYANDVAVSIQADGSVALQFTYHVGGPDDPSVRVADVILPPAVFANIAGPGHRIMQGAADQVMQVANTLAAAVAKRTSMMGDMAGPTDLSRDAIRRARRESAGD